MKRLITLAACLAAGAVMLALPAQGETGAARYIVVLKSDASPAATASRHAQQYGAAVGFVYTSALNGYSAVIPNDRVAALRADDSVAYLSPDGELSALAQTLPTGVNRIEGDQSSTVSGNGSGSVNVNVAVIDTGIDVTHPDLNVVGGVNCSSGSGFNDGNGHGSHVAGTIGARDNGVGVVGVAPGARLYAVRSLNNAGSGSWASVICGVDWVTRTRTDGDPNNNIAVANMSLGGSGSAGSCSDNALREAICNSVAAGVTYVVAAGNSGGSFSSLVPATFPEVLTVTAVADFNGRPGGGAAATCRADVDDTAADFSSFTTIGSSDAGHTIAGPGVCILSTWKRGGYNTISGTSMATPHVAGTAALCIAAGPCAGKTPAQVIAELRTKAANQPASYGFQGAPNNPISSRYYGYLAHAGDY